MYKKLENKSASESERNNLFQEFNKSVNEINNTEIEKFSIKDIISTSVENAIDDIVTNIINTKTVLTSSRDVNEIAEICKKIFSDSNFGTFEYMQRTGRSSFKVNHACGNNGTEFLRKFFERIFKSCMKEYSYDIISDKRHVCIIFR